MKQEHRMGKGEFNYLRDWAENDDDGEKPNYKGIIAALIEEEVARQVSSAVAKAIADMNGKVEAAVSKAMSDMHSKMDTSKADRAAATNAASTNATLIAKVDALESTVRALQAKPQAVHTPQGKIVMQQPVAAKPAAYSVNVARGADGLIKSLDMVPK